MSVRTRISGDTASADAGPARRKRSLQPLIVHVLWALLGLCLVIVLTLVTDPFTNLRMSTVGYYLIAVAGLALLTGFNGQISLGHGAFMFIGAYTVALLVSHVPSFPLWLDLILAAVASGVAGALAGAAAARLKGPYLAGATFVIVCRQSCRPVLV